MQVQVLRIYLLVISNRRQRAFKIITQTENGLRLSVHKY